MTSFNFNTTELVVSFDCPLCGKTITEDVSNLIPEPNMLADTAEESERNESREVECDVCGARFAIEVFKNMNEGNVEVTYHSPKSDVEVNPLQVKASY